jgi:hypothetical protein
MNSFMASDCENLGEVGDIADERCSVGVSRCFSISRIELIKCFTLQNLRTRHIQQRINSISAIVKEEDIIVF